MIETTLAVAGDWAPIRAFDALVRDEPEAAYWDLLPLLRTSDLRIVNCECALTSAKAPVWKSGSTFKGGAHHVLGLTAVPFEVACLANNHVLDYGVAGLRDTLLTLRGNDLLTVGAGLTSEEAFAPLTISLNRTTVHVVNFSEGEDLTGSEGGPGVFGWDVERVVETVARLRKRGDFVVAIGHCGLEYVPYPPPYVVAAFRAIADAGANVVIGHHPHVVQGIEWRGETPIVYSLGNFLFYQETKLRARKVGFFVRLTVRGRNLARLEVHPYRITQEGVRLLRGSDAAAFRRMLARLSKPFESDGGSEAAWRAYLAYYGTRGFEAEVKGILDRLACEPQKGAAMFRNRITTMQHRELWQDVLTMVMEGGRPRYPREAARLVEEYFTREA